MLLCDIMHIRITLWDQSYFFFGLIWFRKADFGICDTHYRRSASFHELFQLFGDLFLTVVLECVCSHWLWSLALSLRRPNGGLFVLSAGFFSSSGEQSRAGRISRAVCGAERWSSSALLRAGKQRESVRMPQIIEPHPFGSHFYNVLLSVRWKCS